MSCWRSSSGANGGRRSRRRWTWKTRGHALAAGQGRLNVFRSKYFSSFFFFFFLILLMIFLREGRQVCRACATAKWQCATAGGTPLRCPGRRWRMWRKEAVVERSGRGRRTRKSRQSSGWWWRSCGDEWQGGGRSRSSGRSRDGPP